MAGEQTLKKLLTPDAQSPSAARITAIAIDGNSIAAMAGDFSGGTLHIDAVHHMEVDRLVEVTRRLRHPIHMDVSISQFPERTLIRDRLRDIFANKAFQNPAVVLISPEKVSVAELLGRPTATAARERLERLIQAQLPYNPFEYPAIVTVQEKRLDSDHSITRIMVARLADLLPLPQMIREAGGEFFGLISALGASAAAVRLLGSSREQKPVLVCDVGKLRTLYTTLLPDGRAVHFPIPVGLARDDIHYFRSIQPQTASLEKMQQSLGRLLFPPEATPSPLFSSSINTPQIDCTRFAIQISRYSTRAIESTLGEDALREPYPGHFYLSGRASRMPGLRQYIEARLNTKLRRIDRRPLRGVTLSPSHCWADVADNLLLAGALQESFSPHALSFGILGGDIAMPPMKKNACSISKMETGVLYVYEQRLKME